VINNRIIDENVQLTVIFPFCANAFDTLFLKKDQKYSSLCKLKVVSGRAN
jgi:hypothetical protein